MTRAVLALVLGVLATGCREELPAKLAPGQAVTLKGALVEGAECPQIEVRGGRRFSLGGDLGSYKVGDRVCVRGTVAQASFCMAGEATLTVTAIGPEDRCP